MSDLAIKCESLSKQYRIGERESYKALRDVITDAVAGPFRRIRAGVGKHNGSEIRNPNSEIRNSFWALDDVSFEVKRGEVLGVIGRNGAGKSTLLKILSRITKPTRGHATINGRLSSLLEVGTGFHPELTGRENIYLNAAILGMRKAEVEKKFDEIVAFAEVETFIDTPVKRYSSGMYVRLAFAVAAHMETELLVVDEVLAVGDSAFQKKCLAKMEQVGKTGQTILFVSHNMNTIQSLCKRALVLEKGRLIADLPAFEAVALYLQDPTARETFVRTKRRSNKPTLISGQLLPITDGASPMMQITVQVQAPQRQRVALDLRLKDSLGTPVGLGTYGAMRPADMIELQPPISEIRFNLETGKLATGSYAVSIDLTLPGVEHYDRAEDCLSFELRREPKEGAIGAFPQEWQYGCMELTLLDLSVVPGVL